jgi:uncharacterized membrane protein YvbJ
MEEKLYCRHCGKQIASDSQFCQHCGSRIEKVTASDLTETQGIIHGTSTSTTKKGGMTLLWVFTEMT